LSAVKSNITVHLYMVYELSLTSSLNQHLFFIHQN